MSSLRLLLHPRRRMLAPVALAAVAAVACGGDDYSRLRATGRVVVRLSKDAPVGTPAERIPISFSEPARIKIDLEVQRTDGSIDTDFNGPLRISAKPGTVAELNGKTTSGRNVDVKDGVASGVEVGLIGAYGNTRIWAEDVGYVATEPTRDPPPSCSDGEDNDRDGTVDFPADVGCAFANDDSEDEGSLIGGVSPTIYFLLPRVADVRGVSAGGSATAFPFEQVSIDTGYDAASNNFRHSVVVTRLAPDGFYYTDIDDPRGFSSSFAFTFSTPPRLGLCDRLTTMTGTAVDFFGFTQLSFATWGVEAYDPAAPHRPCLIPDPFVFGPADYADVTTKFRYESAMVRVETQGTVSVHVGNLFGPKHPGKDLVLKPDATNCDLNDDGKLPNPVPKVEQAVGDEQICVTKCAQDLECTEFANFVARSGFRVVVEDSATPEPAKPDDPPRRVAVQVDASSSPRINPPALRGQPIRAFTGTLRYFSGGAQFTIEARCEADIVLDLAAKPAGSDKACLRARTDIEGER